MPERSQKRKLRSDQSTSQVDEEVASSTNDENTLLSDRDFEDISNKIENKISKRLKDTELNQREILKLIENLSSKVDNLSSTSSERGCLTNRVANNGNAADEVEEIDFSRSEYSNMVTGVSNEPTTSNNTQARSSSLPPPNQRHSDEIIDKLLESLYATHKQTPNIPRLPKALSTTMPTFDGKTEKFELFEDLFQTSLKVHPQITEQEKIHYFHSLLRGDALQTFRNMTETTKANITDIIAGFRRRYVKTQSVATARCKWENLTFDPANQTFQDFLEIYQKLAQEAYADDAPRFIETSFYAKMPAHLKRVLNQARLETASYETMVQHLEREMELNGLANPESTTFTVLHNVEPTNNPNQEKPPKTASTCFGCGHQGHLLRNCRKTNRDKRSQRTPNTNNTNPCETCGKLSHETKDCYSGANWANRPTWRKTPKTTGSNNIHLPPSNTPEIMQQPQANQQPPAAIQHPTQPKNY